MNSLHIIAPDKWNVETGISTWTTIFFIGNNETTTAEDSVWSTNSRGTAMLSVVTTAQNDADKIRLDVINFSYLIKSTHESAKQNSLTSESSSMTQRSSNR